MADTERRFTPVPVQVRTDGERRKIGGYAALFDKVSRNLGGFVEVVLPPFFNRTRSEGWPDVICRYNHDDNMLLGTSGGRTLELGIDGTGLTYEVDPPQARADILELVARGDVRRSSFAFRVDSDGQEWTVTDQGYPLRKLVSGQLVDVAPVNSPAYGETTVGLRAEARLMALRSLAVQVQVSIEEVRKMADDDELCRFFVRTDNKGTPKPPAKPRQLGAAALVDLMGRREDPYV
jgi:uncharacterized protein